MQACERGCAWARRDSANACLPEVRQGAHRPQSDVAGLVGGGQHGRRRARVELQVHDARGDHLRGASAGALGDVQRVARRAPRRALADAHARGTPGAGPRVGERCACSTGAAGVRRSQTSPPEAPGGELGQAGKHACHHVRSGSRHRRSGRFEPIIHRRLPAPWRRRPRRSAARRPAPRSGAPRRPPRGRAATPGTPRPGPRPRCPRTRPRLLARRQAMTQLGIGVRSLRLRLSTHCASSGLPRRAGLVLSESGCQVARDVVLQRVPLHAAHKAAAFPPVVLPDVGPWCAPLGWRSLGAAGSAGR